MLKHRCLDNAHACRHLGVLGSRCTSQRTTEARVIREGTKSNGYRGTGPGERVGSVNERSSHHRMMLGQLHDAQTPANRPLPHVETARGVLGDWTHQTVQEGTESNGYRGTGPGERVGSVNERTSHHRVVSGQLHDTQTPANRPLPHV